MKLLTLQLTACRRGTDYYPMYHDRHVVDYINWSKLVMQSWCLKTKPSSKNPFNWSISTGTPSGTTVTDIDSFEIKLFDWVLCSRFDKCLVKWCLEVSIDWTNSCGLAG